ncbi:SpoIIE family protein phosphatase [Streptomyces chrestomyceticus]|uniref:SpoIIE family protein phosphatase n=1 Tax=Streptomyces chrestomyceticus TaxID=68185 RepID=UPI0037B5B500
MDSRTEADTDPAMEAAGATDAAVGEGVTEATDPATGAREAEVTDSAMGPGAGEGDGETERAGETCGAPETPGTPEVTGTPAAPAEAVRVEAAPAETVPAETPAAPPSRPASGPGPDAGPAADGRDSVRRSSLPGNPRAAAAARQFVRAVLADWVTRSLPGSDALGDRLADEAVLLVSELVTNVVVHAGTTVELLCRLEAGTDAGPKAGTDTGADADVADAAPATDPDRDPAPNPTPNLPRTTVVIEVSDHHPARAVRARQSASANESRGHGLQLVGAVAESWGITYRRDLKTVWFRLPAGPRQHAYGPPARFSHHDLELQRGLRAAELLAPTPVRRSPARRSEADWINHGALSFLAEASDLLSGQLDEEQVALLAAQLVVPRLADWCAVWLHSGGREGTGEAPRLARVWHSSESRIDALRMALEKEPPVMPVPGPQREGAGAAVPWPWPQEPSGYGPGGAALACRLVAGGRDHGTLLIGRAGLMRFPDEVVGLIEDLTRRVARALATARAYRNQERISQVLQRRLLPRGRPAVPGLESSVVYEPREGAWAGGDFWDLFDAGNGRWCFALGDVCGNGPEAAAVTGLARPVLRLLARDGFGVGEVLDRLNKTMAREAADSVAAVTAAVAAAGSGLEPSVELRAEGEQTRFLSLLYGEIEPHADGTAGARCTLASAGHPLPLVLGTDGAVRIAAAPQMLVGVVEDTSYEAESFELAPGETLLCVTDGVTERRSGHRQFDDDDGLAHHFAACTGLGATAVAEHIRRAVHAFADTPPDDDLALLVLQATGQR